MPASLDTRTRRLLRRVPQTVSYPALELVLVALLALQCARLFWTLVEPIGPVGDWRPARTMAPKLTASPELLASFDPFFRLSASSAPATVTSLNLRLFGIREDRASGRGSAIIGTPEGQQKSYVVGEEIMPGVTLQAVEFDSITINRNGASEQIFMDQSGPAPVVTPPTTSAALPASLPSATANQVQPILPKAGQ